MTPAKFIEDFSRLQFTLADQGGMTFCGWILATIRAGLRTHADQGVDLVSANFLADGVAARLYCRQDKRYYSLEIKPLPTDFNQTRELSLSKQQGETNHGTQRRQT